MRQNQTNHHHTRPLTTLKNAPPFSTSGALNCGVPHFPIICCLTLRWNCCLTWKHLLMYRRLVSGILQMFKWNMRSECVCAWENTITVAKIADVCRYSVGIHLLRARETKAATQFWRLGEYGLVIARGDFQRKTIDLHEFWHFKWTWKILSKSPAANLPLGGIHHWRHNLSSLGDS